MSAAAAVLGRVKFIRDNTVSVSCVTVIPDAARYKCFALEIAHAMEAVPAHAHRGIVVELQPRDFQQTAAHFLRVATPVAWLTDEHDVD